MEAILDRWLTQALRCYSDESARFVSAEIDPFRNPVAHILRTNLAILLDYVKQGNEAGPAQAALQEILRIHAVQDVSASTALQFIFDLRPILRNLPAPASATVHDERIDQLALWAFEEYTRCRERIHELRINESRRSIGVIAARRAAKADAGSIV